MKSDSAVVDVISCRCEVETLLAYFTAFQATLEEAELVLSLLPHVVGRLSPTVWSNGRWSRRPNSVSFSQVTSQHAPIGQGFTVSDLDLVLREEMPSFKPDRGRKPMFWMICEEHNDVSIKCTPQP